MLVHACSLPDYDFSFAAAAAKRRATARGARERFEPTFHCSPASPPSALMDDWAACDAEAVVAALSVRYRFSLANAVQLLRDRGILPQREVEEEEEEA